MRHRAVVILVALTLCNGPLRTVCAGQGEGTAASQQQAASNATQAVLQPAAPAQTTVSAAAQALPTATQIQAPAPAPAPVPKEEPAAVAAAAAAQAAAAATQDKPAAAKKEQPATAKRDDPVTAEREAPAVVKREEPAAGEKDAPAADKKDQPANKDKPAAAQQNKTAAGKKDAPPGERVATPAAARKGDTGWARVAARPKRAAPARLTAAAPAPVAKDAPSRQRTAAPAPAGTHAPAQKGASKTDTLRRGAAKDATPPKGAAAPAAKRPGTLRQSAAPKPFFIPIEITGANALENGKTVVWKESSWVRPDGNNPDTSAADWRLIRIRVEGEQTEWANVVSWTTGCGYLQWFKDTKQIRYTAEVDGCGESWSYDAVKVANNNVVQEGKARIVVAVDNCFYSRCEQEGCGDACRCTSKATGNCHCGGGLAGFIDIYNWEKNRESCVYDSFKPMTPSGATQGLFETKLRNNNKVLIPIKFGKDSSRACLPFLASSKLKFTRVKCSRISPKPDSRQATVAKPYSGQAAQGSVVGQCSDFDGIYNVVLQVPKWVGQYNCVASLGDDLGDRVLGQLRVKS